MFNNLQLQAIPVVGTKGDGLQRLQVLQPPARNDHLASLISFRQFTFSLLGGETRPSHFPCKVIDSFAVSTYRVRQSELIESGRQLWALLIHLQRILRVEARARPRWHRRLGTLRSYYSKDSRFVS